MSLALMLILQAAASPPVPGAAGSGRPELIPLDFDLKKLSRSDPCGGDSPSEIVVCGRRELNHVYPLSAGFETEPIVARMEVAGNVTADVHLETVAFPQGAKSNRVMVSFKLPF